MPDIFYGLRDAALRGEAFVSSHRVPLGVAENSATVGRVQ